MRKTILTILGSALLAASTVQIAAAAEHQKVRKIYRAPAPVTEDFRNSNAYWGFLDRSICRELMPPQFHPSMMATARVQPAEALSILTGKHETVKPVDGNCSRLCSFSMWQ